MRLRPAPDDDERSTRSPSSVVSEGRSTSAPAPVGRIGGHAAPHQDGTSLSIVIPVLPGAAYLGDAVGSALAQERPADEVVVLDAGPPGGPGSVIESAGLAGVRYERHGSTDAASLWNAAVERASGDVVIVLEPDDVLLASAVGDHLAALDASSDRGVSVGDVLVLGDDLRPVDEVFWGPSSAVGHLAAGDWLPVGSMAIRRSVLATVGGFRPELDSGALAEWLAAAVATTEIGPAGRHTLARRSVGFDQPEARARLTVLRTLIETAGPVATVGDGASLTEGKAWLEAGLRLLRLGDARAALGCLECAEADTPTPAGAEMVLTVRRALDAGELDLVDSHPVRQLPAAPAAPATPPASTGRPRSGPTITIAIPTFDRADLLGEALDSAVSQTRPADEILVVDDGSTDHTREVAARYVGEGVRYVHQENQGGPLARNRCISEATGAFVLWLDSDDVIAPNTIDTHLARLADVPDADVVYGDLDVVDERLRPTRHQGYQDWYGDRHGLVAALFQGNCIPNPSTMIRRSVLVGSGGYHPDFRRAHDYEMFSRLAGSASFAHHADTVLRYRMHDGDALSGTMEGKDLRYELTVVHRMLDRYPLEVLIPEAGWGDVEPAEAEATAHVRVAVRLMHLADTQGALERARAAVALRPIPAAEQLVATLDDAIRTGLAGQRPLTVLDLAETSLTGAGVGDG